MFSFGKNKKGVAEINLSAKPDSLKDADKVWRSDEDIAGSAVYTLPPGVQFSHSKVVLKGVVTVGTEDVRRRGLQPSWRMEKLTFLSVGLDSKARPDFKSDSGIIKIPFHFNLDECSRLSKLADLPPSVDSKEGADRWASLKTLDSRYQYRITYTISAAAYSSRGILATTTRNISVLPVAETRPPLYSSHFPGEYFTGASSPREPKHRKHPAGHRFEVSSQEPEPLKLDPAHISSQASVEAPFVAKLIPDDGGVLRRDALPTQCEITARLVTRTIVTPNGAGTVPTARDVSNDEDSHMRTSRSNEQSATISIPKWERVATGFDEQFALTQLPFRFRIEDEHQLGPSFFTPLLTRRYAIEMEMRFPESSTCKLELSLPLQVVYEADGLDLTGLKSSLTSDCR